MQLFSHDQVNLSVLRKTAFNYRWAEVPEGVIPLTAADSDFPCAPEIQEGLCNYLKQGYLSYTPKLGYPEVRSSIAKKLNERKHENVDPDLLLPIDSAARGMYIIAQTILKPGDEMIIFDPVDYLFGKSCESAGATPVLCPSLIKNGELDLSHLEEYITPKTKMIGLCNPHNPLGKLYQKEALQHLLDVAEKYDLYIMNDEIWSDIVFSGKRFCSILTVDPGKSHRVLSVYGLSKAFSIAGLRAGCIYCSTKEMFDRMVEKSHVMTTAGGIASISQFAMKICMDECYYWNEAFVAQMEKNRDYALQRIGEMPGISCEKPDATFLLFPDISATGMESGDFVAFIEKEARLALVPGTPKFFGPGAQGHVRICLSTSDKILAEAMDRLAKGMSMIMNR
ncbi:MAG: pyridoxal phosphate-dependent aminotransferase [Christensenellales bacterium]|jgi:aspartate/methionine/tyrosine aminotransferase